MSATSISNRKERAGLNPGPDSLRLGFLGQQTFTLAAPLLASRSGTGLAPTPNPFGARKPSVPGRVHSVLESCGSQAALGALPGSNPFLTHGTVESPAKLFLRRFLKNREPPLPISPVAPGSNTCLGWRPLSKINSSSSLSAFRESRRLQSVLWLQGPTLFLVGGGSHKFIFSSVPTPETSGWARNGFVWP